MNQTFRGSGIPWIRHSINRTFHESGIKRIRYPWIISSMNQAFHKSDIPWIRFTWIRYSVIKMLHELDIPWIRCSMNRTFHEIRHSINQASMNQAFHESAIPWTLPTAPLFLSYLLERIAKSSQINYRI